MKMIMKKDIEMQDTVAVCRHRENAHKRARGREKERETEKEKRERKKKRQRGRERGTLNHHVQPEVKRYEGEMNVKICGSAGHTER